LSDSTYYDVAFYLYVLSFLDVVWLFNSMEKRHDLRKRLPTEVFRAGWLFTEQVLYYWANFFPRRKSCPIHNLLKKNSNTGRRESGGYP